MHIPADYRMSKTDRTKSTGRHSGIAVAERLQIYCSRTLFSSIIIATPTAIIHSRLVHAPLGFSLVDTLAISRQMLGR